jgi:hypothetical protein
LNLIMIINIDKGLSCQLRVKIVLFVVIVRIE